MTTIVEARYLKGTLILPQPLALPEDTLVQLTIQTPDVQTDDPARATWLKVSEESLHTLWDNSGDDVFNELLAK